MTATDDSSTVRAERKMDELHEDVVRVRIVLAELTSEVKAANAAAATRDARQQDHEQRIRELERVVPDDLPLQLEQGKRFRYMLVGAALAGGGVVGGITGAAARFL